MVRYGRSSDGLRTRRPVLPSNPAQVTESHQRLRDEEIDRIYRAHAGWLKAELRKRSGSFSPDDLVQEAFLRIARYPASIPLRFPRALLLTIAKNIARSSLRRNPSSGAFGVLYFSAESASVGPDQVEAIVLKQTVLSLPEIYRDVFMLSRFGGMSYQEIAEARGLSVKTVEWRMSKALAMCAARMRE